MNILLAYNDTDVSNGALERAAQLAGLYEAKLVVTSVTPALRGDPQHNGPGPELKEARKTAQRLGFQDSREAFAAGGGRSVDVEV